MHKAKWTPRQISFLPSVSRPRSIIRQLRDFRSCLMIDLGRETDGNNEICLGVHFALCIIKSSTTRSYWALFLGRWSPFFLILRETQCNKISMPLFLIVIFFFFCCLQGIMRDHLWCFSVVFLAVTCILSPRLRFLCSLVSPYPQSEF